MIRVSGEQWQNLPAWILPKRLMTYSSEISQADARVSVVILFMVLIGTIFSYITAQTLKQLYETGQLSSEWVPYAELFKGYQPSSMRSYHFQRKAKRATIKEVVISALVEAKDIKNGLIANFDPMRERKIILRTRAWKGESKKPSMFIRQGETEVDNPLEHLPYLVALPFRVADKTFDVATSLTASYIDLVVFAPVRVTRSVLSYII